MPGNQDIELGLTGLCGSNSSSKPSENKDVDEYTRILTSSSPEETALTSYNQINDHSPVNNQRTIDDDSNSTSGRNYFGISQNNEIRETGGMFGISWRKIFRFILTRLVVSDQKNALQFSRALQIQLDYLSAHESALLGDVITALDGVPSKNNDIREKLTAALENRNVGRTLIQAFGVVNKLWHMNFQIKHVRKFDALSRTFFLGSKLSFPPPTENDLSSRGLAVDSMLRKILGPGRFLTRLVTGGREEFIVDDENATAQNLAAESNGFEVSLRNQLGNNFGRHRISEFRTLNRLPTDEGVLRTFFTQPVPTMLNNGVVHVLSVIGKHWKNMLDNPFGNFGHQRMEMLDICLTLRFHMPAVLLTLANLRGLHSWDAANLANLVDKLLLVRAGTDMQEPIRLINEVEANIKKICGPNPTHVVLLRNWLQEISRAVEVFLEESKKLKGLLSAASNGINAGTEVLKNTKWEVPPDSTIVTSIVTHIKLDMAKSKLRDQKLISEDNGTVDIDGENRNKCLKRLETLTFNDMKSLESLLVSEHDSDGFLSKEFIQDIMGRIKDEGGDNDLNQPIINVAGRSRFSRGKSVQLTQFPHDSDEFRLFYALLKRIESDLRERNENGMNGFVCRRALGQVTPRDKRTLIQLVLNGLEDCKPAQLLLKRTKTLIRRELRRTALDDQMEGKRDLHNQILQAQKQFMIIENECMKRFSYDAYLELDDFRSDLEKLQIIAQIQCRSLDDARLGRLAAICKNPPALVKENQMKNGTTYFIEERRGVYEELYYTGDERLDGEKRIFKVPPQNMIVVGGGPSGLLTALHCLENCLWTGGSLRLLEARDAFQKAGGTYERAQVVRLDSRWIRMLRFHLGTGFEDVFIPADGETDAHLGNTIPDQGFVEITIKDLENILHLEISKLWSVHVEISKGRSVNLIDLQTKSNARFDPIENIMVKRGDSLKVNDVVRRKVDKNGKISKDYHSWEITELKAFPRLTADQLVLKGNYLVHRRSVNQLKPVELIGIDLEGTGDKYKFKEKQTGNDTQENIITKTKQYFPEVYNIGTPIDGHHTPKSIVYRCLEGVGFEEEIEFNEISRLDHMMDISQTNIVFATGKPSNSKQHLKITGEEPYGVACIQGLKISLNMHNFGEKRWGDGIIDDIRSQREPNTRVVGDFTKSVSVPPIVAKMHEILSTGSRSKDWDHYFNTNVDNIAASIKQSLDGLKTTSKDWKRQRLQTRFFETGDNFYLGMEFNREYVVWKKDIADEWKQGKGKDSEKDALQIQSRIDRLWFEAAFAIIKQGDVYNPSGKDFIPKVNLIDSFSPMKAESLVVGDSFRKSSDPQEKYEVLLGTGTKGNEFHNSKNILVRSVEGLIESIMPETDVLMQSDLTRGPDGNAESKVAIATFPVAHYVNYRTLTFSSPHWCTMSIGDAQCAPHFMRYSGLTGAGISSMLINNYLVNFDSQDISSKRRIRELSRETTWSNDEVITRGTGANFGVDAFLRPSFKSEALVKYLYERVKEMQEIGELDQGGIHKLLTDSWMLKFAAALIPRGLESSTTHAQSLRKHFSTIIFEHVLRSMAVKMKLEKKLEQDLASIEFGDETYSTGELKKWSERVNDLCTQNGLTSDRKEDVKAYMTRSFIVFTIIQEICSLSEEGYEHGSRISSESENQPSSADTLIVDMSFEVQIFANGLAMSALLATLIIALNQADQTKTFASNLGIVLAIINVSTTFGTITNVARYQNRLEEFRSEYCDNKFFSLEKALFASFSAKKMQSHWATNPFIKSIKIRYQNFEGSSKYYNADSKEIQNEYEDLLANLQRDNRTRLEGDDVDFESLRKHLSTFAERIITYYIPIHYQKEVYLKDNLFQLKVACEEMKTALDDILRSDDLLDAPIESLFTRLPSCYETFQKSLQNGPIVFGFVRKGKRMRDLAIFSPAKYFISLLSNIIFFCPFFEEKIVTSYYPIPTTIKKLSVLVNKINNFRGDGFLGSQAVDLENLFDATMSSALSNTIYFAGCASFTFAILQVLNNTWTSINNRFVNPRPISWTQSLITEGAAIIGIYVASLAMWHFQKLNRHQRKLILKMGELPAPCLQGIQAVKRIAKYKYFESLVRFIAATLTICSLLCAFLVRLNTLHQILTWSPSQSDLVMNLALYGAIASITCWGIASAIGWFVEFHLMWNFDLDLASEDIRTSFHSQFNQSTRSRHAPDVGEVPPLTERRVARDDAMNSFFRDARFDTILDPNRFYTLMQHFQNNP